MGRKNHRREAFSPVDYTGVTIPVNIPSVRNPNVRETPEQYDARWDERRKREERQRKARIAEGIDWSICLVVGCGAELKWYGRLPRDNRRDPDLELPLCFDHLAVVFKMGVTAYRDKPEFIEAIADINEAVAARDKREHEEQQEAFLARENGQIYFVRIGGLVKVGWTRDLWSRIKSYGASAELLAAYDATRQDETNLHRQLTPARAKGREWYEDGDIIAKFIAEALAKYGVPPALEGMWTQPKQIVAGKRHR